MPVLNINTAIIKDGKILLTKREDFEVWCIPGGAVDPGESVTQAAIREAREETGLHVEITRLVGIYSMPRWIAGGTHALLFAATPTSDRINPDPNEVIDIGFFSPETLPSPLLFGHKQRVSDAFNGAGGALAWVQDAIWPYEQELSRQELYTRRDQSGLSRPAFYQILVEDSGPGIETLEVGYHQEGEVPGVDYTKIRRKERGRDTDWIIAFLARAEFGTMATAQGDQPFLVTRNFAYDEATHAVYMHGAKKGRTHNNAMEAPRVCFSASESGRLLPASRAVNLGTEFGGVVAFGRLNVVEDLDEAKHGLQLLCDKYFPHLKPGVDYKTTIDTDLKVTAVLRLDIESWSGKEKKAPADFPGAFYFDDVLE